VLLEKDMGIIWLDSVKNEGMRGVKAERNILCTKEERSLTGL